MEVKAAMAAAAEFAWSNAALQYQARGMQVTVSPFIRAPAAVPRPNNSFARIGYTTAAPLAKLPASPALCCQDIFQELGVKDKLPQRGGRAAVMQETDKQVR